MLRVPPYCIPVQQCCKAATAVQENELATRATQPSSIAVTDEHASKQKDVSTTLEGLQYAQRDVTMLGFQFPKDIPALFFLTR